MIATKPITNTEDTIDTRDILERINWLEPQEPELYEDETKELTTLKNLIEQLDEEELEYDVQLIRDSYFIVYAQELAEDIGAINRDAQWPLEYIDWGAAADALKMDYSTVDFDGVEYWVRS